MFKLQRPNNRQSKPREKLDFKFSNFQALQVPKGWDRLFVSLISVETGKTIARLGNALVRNGSCQWMETLSESFSISRDDSTKEYEESLIKIVVSTGSTRSSNLGEATINMAHYTSTRASAAVSQPLKRCSHGTILQVKIQCLTPRPKTRDDESHYSSSLEKDLKQNDLGSQSNGSRISSDGSVRLHEGQTSSPDPPKFDSKETSHSAGQHHSFNSNEDSIERENLSTRNSFKDKKYHSKYEREIGDTLHDSPIPDHYSVENESPIHGESFNSRLSLGDDSQSRTTFNRSSMMNYGSSRNLLEAAEDSIQELRAEAKMWERNARKLLVDLDMSRKEFTDLSKMHDNSVMELSASHSERDSLKREVEQLKIELQPLTTKLAMQEDSTIQSKHLIQIQKELENEIKYQRNMNADLDQQLKRTQESNLELVSVLQELEEIIEQQRMEINNLSSLELDFSELQNSIAKNSEDNRNLLLQLQKLKDSEKNLQSEVQLLDIALRNKSEELENERSSNSQFLICVEKDYMYKLSVKEEEIARLEELQCCDENNAELMREVESLKEKIVELEKDCNELTDENLELLFKLKDSSKTAIREYASFDSMSNEHPSVSRSDESEVSDPHFHISHIEEELKNEEKEFVEIFEQLNMAFDLLMKPWFDIASNTSQKCISILDELTNANKGKELPETYFLSVLLELNKLLEARIAECEEIHRHHEIEIKEKDSVIKEHEKSRENIEENYADIVKELDRRKSEVDLIKTDLLSKEEEIKFILQHQSELEVEFFELQQENSDLEQKWELESRERNTVSECLKNLQNDFNVLSETVDSHVSAKTILERRLEEIESKRNELESMLSGLRDEKMQLKESILCLEAQVRRLNDEKSFLQQERDYSESVAIDFQDEIQKLRVEMDVHVLDLKQHLEETEIQCLQSQLESLYLRAENHNSNVELKQENEGLQEHCSDLDFQLRKSKDTLSDCEKKVDFLENQLTSALEEFALRESNLNSQLVALVQENSSQREFEALQIEVDHMKRQIDDAHEEREIIYLEASGEVSRLLADKAELQASLQEVRSTAALTKNELDQMQLESDMKIQELIGQLASLQEDHEILMADHERTLKMLANYKKSEERLKTDINDLELKLTISDYECKQLSKEVGVLKVQLQNISGLEDDIATLKREIKQCRLDKGKLELALQTVSGDYEELNTEKISLSEKIFSLQDALSEFEECKSKRLALEEKIAVMKNELAGNELLHVQINNLKNEITEVKRTNIQFQQTIYCLEEENREWLQKAQSLEEDLKLMEERFDAYKEVAQDYSFGDESYLAEVSNHTTQEHSLEKKAAEELDANKENRTQRKSRFSAGQNSNAVPRKSVENGRVVAREKYERTKSSLETELRDLSERYLKMSLKYAEVEAQREDLVMKLKATGSGRRWFS